MRLPMIPLTDREMKVVEMFRGLEPGRQPYVLMEMAKPDPEAWNRVQAKVAAQLRTIAQGKGVDWDRLDDDQRQDFVEREFDGGKA